LPERYSANAVVVATAAKKAADVGVKRFVEVSTAFVYKSQAKQPAAEGAELQPWTLQAKYKLEVCIIRAGSIRV
jgi:dTDP-4-dehydrorhamnose reductase